MSIVRNDNSKQQKLDQLKELGFMLAEPRAERAPTEAECLLVGCPVCHAKREFGCTINRIFSTVQSSDFVHAERRELAKLNVNTLSNYDIAIIIQYAFLIACDSISANSEKMFSRAYTPDEIKRFFASNSIKELKEAGFFI